MRAVAMSGKPRAIGIIWVIWAVHQTQPGSSNEDRAFSKQHEHYLVFQK